jgi:hypothetical protein
MKERRSQELRAILGELRSLEGLLTSHPSKLRTNRRRVRAFNNKISVLRELQLPRPPQLIFSKKKRTRGASPRHNKSKPLSHQRRLRKNLYSLTHTGTH